jgi:hypothetical protein
MRQFIYCRIPALLLSIAFSPARPGERFDGVGHYRRPSPDGLGDGGRQTLAARLVSAVA